MTVPGDAAATTETVSAHRPSSNGAVGWTLIWVFPRAAAQVSLPSAGAAEVVLGREASCTVVLDGADVSRRHVAFSHDEKAGLMVRDLASRNGLWLNGVRVPAATVRLGDVVRVGGWLGVVARAAGVLDEAGGDPFVDRRTDRFVELFAGLWGGAALREVLAPLERAAPSNLPIVLEGETGTGKEVVARGIHERSGRKGPFLAINCGALPEGLAESELFGHRRGAFTGAERGSLGVFRSADQGTLLLDEIGDLPASVQTKLLRVLEEGAVQPLGEARAVPVDVRIIAAGQQSLRRVATEGRFRVDLLARLEGLTLRLPPLRERREDVVPLFRHWLARCGGASPELELGLAEALSRHDWPFNVRELVFLVRRLVTLHGHLPQWGAALLPVEMTGASGAPDAADARTEGAAASSMSSMPATTSAPSLASLLAALRTAGGNVARAAAMLGVSRQRLYRLMEGADVDLEALRKVEEDRADG